MFLTYVFLDRISWDNFNESGDFKKQVELFKKYTGYYPESVHVDSAGIRVAARLMAKLPHTSETAITITFLVMNLSQFLRQIFCFFYVYLKKTRVFSDPELSKIIFCSLKITETYPFCWVEKTISFC